MLSDDYWQILRDATDDLHEVRSSFPQVARKLPSLLSGIAQSIGTSPSELATIRAEVSDSPEALISFRNRRYQEWLERLIGECSNLGLAVPTACMAASFPSDSFNAQAVSVAHGHLLLMHQGLQTFLIEASRIIRSIHFCLTGQYAAGWPTPRWFHTLRVETGIELLARLSLSFIEFDSSSSLLFLPAMLDGHTPFDARTELPSFAAADSAEAFVLAHELGHSIAGHLKLAAPQFVRLPNGRTSAIRKEWAQEFEADAVAVRLLFGARVDAVTEVLELIAQKYFGIGLFFDLDDLLVSIELAMEGRPGNARLLLDHPPSLQRERRIVRRIRATRAPSAFAERRALSKTYRRIRDQVVAKALEVR